MLSLKFHLGYFFLEQFKISPVILFPCSQGKIFSTISNSKFSSWLIKNVYSTQKKTHNLLHHMTNVLVFWGKYHFWCHIFPRLSLNNFKLFVLSFFLHFRVKIPLIQNLFLNLPKISAQIRKSKKGHNRASSQGPFFQKHRENSTVECLCEFGVTQLIRRVAILPKKYFEATRAVGTKVHEIL